MYLFFDLETNGLPKSRFGDIDNINNWPRIVQIAWTVFNENQIKILSKNYIIFPKDFEIPEDIALIHGITTDQAKRDGIPIQIALCEFNRDIKKSKIIVAHNLDFDLPILNAEFLRNNIFTNLLSMDKVCTMKSERVIQYCRIINPYGSGYKWPTLNELHKILFNIEPKKCHDASIDTDICANCYFELLKRGVLE